MFSRCLQECLQGCLQVAQHVSSACAIAQDLTLCLTIWDYLIVTGENTEVVDRTVTLKDLEVGFPEKVAVQHKSSLASI